VEDAVKHKFKVGDIVIVKPQAPGTWLGGSYETVPTLV
jgi:hypothetical protein